MLSPFPLCRPTAPNSPPRHPLRALFRLFLRSAFRPPAYPLRNRSTETCSGVAGTVRRQQKEMGCGTRDAGDRGDLREVRKKRTQRLSEWSDPVNPVRTFSGSPVSCCCCYSCFPAASSHLGTNPKNNIVAADFWSSRKIVCTFHSTDLFRFRRV